MHANRCVCRIILYCIVSHHVVQRPIAFPVSPYFLSTPAAQTAFFGLLGVVTMEIMLVARYWTWLFFWLCFLSYAVGWLFYAVYPFIVNGTGQWDGAWSAGATFEVFSTGYFWFSILTTYALCFGYRYFQRVWLWLYRPQDSMILTEKEMLVRVYRCGNIAE